MQASASRDAARFWLACAAVYAAVLGLYWPSLSFRPISLDDLSQLQAATSQSFAQIFAPDRYGHVRPVKSALFIVLARSPELWGAFRIGMLAVLLAATVLVQRLATRLTGSRGAGLAVAACWALNPTTASAICWLSAANVALCAIGILLYLECARRALEPALDRPSPRAPSWLALALFCLLLALASHELAVVAPLLLWTRTKLFAASAPATPTRRSARLVYLGSAAVVLLCVAFVLATARLQAAYRFGSEPAWLIGFSAARYLAENVLLWLLPAGRFGVLLGDRPAQQLIASSIAWLVLLGAGVLLWKQRLRDPVISFGLVWVVITLAPVANFVPLGNTPLAMHYAVVPGVGLSLVLVRALQAFARRVARDRFAAYRPLLAGALIAGLGASFLPATTRAIEAWGDEERLFATTVENHPDEIEPLVNLASVHLDRRQYERAASVLERARALEPDDLGVLRNEFALRWQTGRFADAVALLDRHPKAAERPEFQLGRGQALARLGRTAEAAVALQRAFDSDSPEIDRELRFAAGYQLMGALLQTGRRSDAERIFDRLYADYPEREELRVVHQLLRGAP
jgi:tetratricopeptide (TPR) repeat protein